MKSMLFIRLSLKKPFAIHAIPIASHFFPSDFKKLTVVLSKAFLYKTIDHFQPILEHFIE
jgi:hypothetical protein